MTFRILSWSLILFACFFGIGSYPLFDNNEGLYASIARDMLATKQFIIPHLVGLPYLEKPPMLYWLMALSISIFGTNEWAVRLIPAMAFFLTAVFLQRGASRISGNEKTGFAAALMFVTSLPILIWGREILCDMLMTCFFSAALFKMQAWLEKSKKSDLITFYAFIALAVLTKGFIAIFLAGGIAFVFILWERRPWRDYSELLSPLGIVIFLCITAPWHIAASLQEQGFAWFYFINEHLLRFVDMREPHDYHTGSWWYYLPRVIGCLLPWTLFLLIFLRKPQPSATPYRAPARFLWSWFFVCLVFFSAAGSKSNYYMIVGMPALVALVALHIKTAMDTGSRVTRSLTSGSFVVLLVFVWFILHFCTENYGYLMMFCQNVPQNYLIGFAVYSTACIILCWRVHQYWLAPLLASYIVLLLPLLINGVNNTGQMLSQKEVALQLQSSPSSQIAIFQDFEEVSALAFYMNKPLLIVDSQSSDLLYGQKRQVKPDMFLSLDEWTRRKPYVPMVVLKNKLDSVMSTLISEHFDMKHVCIPQRFDRVVIVSICDHGR